MKKFLFYLLRWQLSSPILAVCLVWLGGLGPVWATIIANLVGGCIFFFVDKRIFKEDKCSTSSVELVRNKKKK